MLFLQEGACKFSRTPIHTPPFITEQERHHIRNILRLPYPLQRNHLAQLTRNDLHIRR
jgi:hypothetical protein